jgi:hypothetical protein
MSRKGKDTKGKGFIFLNPHSAQRKLQPTFRLKTAKIVNMLEKKTAIQIVGGGLGGIAPALSAARLDFHTILTEETGWIGGQLTAQAMLPDENAWIETEGCNASYRRLREGIRAYFRRNYPLLLEAAADPQLNPGLGYVSGLCHEPRVGLAVLEEMLAPWRASRQVEVLLNRCPVAVEMDGDFVRAVTLQNADGGEDEVIHADYFLDATELGDFLELGNIEHVTGSESQAETGEPHAWLARPTRSTSRESHDAMP